MEQEGSGNLPIASTRRNTTWLVPSPCQVAKKYSANDSTTKNDPLKKQRSDPAREPTTAINVRKRQSNMICIQNPKIHIEVKCKQLRQRVPVHLQWTSVISVYLSVCA
jgi:hypothetical protein